MLRDCSGIYFSPYPSYEEKARQAEGEQRHCASQTPYRPKPGYTQDGVCSMCHDIKRTLCNKCHRCEACYHKPWCSGKFEKVMG